jgi:surfactin synthase thioesterase subunit
MDKLGEGHPQYLACKQEYEGLKRLSDDQTKLHLMVDEHNATVRIQRRLQAEARTYGHTIGALFDFETDRIEPEGSEYVQVVRAHGHGKHKEEFVVLHRDRNGEIIDGLRTLGEVTPIKEAV